MIGIIILAIVLIKTIILIVIYNKLVTNSNHMREAWSGIDVFLKKRSDLVPSLVETVKGYASHERNTMEEITRCRSQVMEAGDINARVQSENKLAKALSNLFIIAESYPDLKANNNFLTLQKQLVEIENDLEYARRYYNGTVRENNIYIERFPSNIVAWIFKFRQGVFFTAKSSERENPEITL